MIISPTRRWIGRTARLVLVLTIGMIAYAWRYAHAADRQFYRFTRNVVSPDGTSRNVLRQHIDVLDLMRSTHGDLVETTTRVILLRGTLYLNIEKKLRSLTTNGRAFAISSGPSTDSLPYSQTGIPVTGSKYHKPILPISSLPPRGSASRTRPRLVSAC
jgi:hypothetical protein